MIRLIIIALVSFSSASFAAAGKPGGGKARLKKMLACETALTDRLSEAHRALLARLQTVVDKYEAASMTTPGFAEKKMRVSAATLYAEFNALAGQILEIRQPRNVADLDLILTRIEVQLNMALPRSTRPEPTAVAQTPSSRKARMETRHFDEDWSAMYPPPSKQVLVEKRGTLSEVSDMPIGPHDFNSAQKPSDQQQQQQQQRRRQQEQPRLQRLAPPGSGKAQMETRNFESDWEQPLAPEPQPTEPEARINPDSFLYESDGLQHWNWPPREKP